MNNNYFRAIDLAPRGYAAAAQRPEHQSNHAGTTDSITVHHPDDMNRGGVHVTQIFPTPSTQSNNFIFQHPGQYCISLYSDNSTQPQGQQLGSGKTMPLAFLIRKAEQSNPKGQTSSTVSNDARIPVISGFQSSTPYTTSNGAANGHGPV